MRGLIIFHLRALVVWEGKLGRLSYALMQSLLLALTAGATAALQHAGYGHDATYEAIHMLAFWPLTLYPVSQVGPIGAFISFPITWMMLCLAHRRLRDVEWSEWALLLLFIPVLGHLFTGALAVVPGWRAWELGHESKPLLRGITAQLIPRSALGSAVFAILFSAFAVYACGWVSIQCCGEYGWALFVLLPFLIGLVSAVLYGFHQPRTYMQCLGVSIASATTSMFVLLGLQLEGVICIVMAIPLLIPFLMLGSAAGYQIQLRPTSQPRRGRALMSIFLWPLALVSERAVQSEPPLIQAHTSILIDAPIEKVWTNVVTFADLPAPHEWLFRTGIAYPVRATIDGSGPGAVRYCQFTTGSFVEPIEIWNEPTHLRFKVTQNPPVMKEMNPFGEVDAPHLNGFFESRQGEFRLFPLPGSRTLLVGTTWYQHQIAPQPYWRLWSDQIIHAIHSRVLAHIKRESERDGG